MPIETIYLVNGLWISILQFIECVWIWKEMIQQIQFMGTRNLKRQGSSLHSELEVFIWIMKNSYIIQPVSTLDQIAKI